MSDLTELGFLEQPHTSAGRIPSEKAYRLYVNSIMDRAKLTDEEAEYIRRHLNTRVNEVGEVIRERQECFRASLNILLLFKPRR